MIKIGSKSKDEKDGRSGIRWKNKVPYNGAISGHTSFGRKKHCTLRCDDRKENSTFFVKCVTEKRCGMMRNRRAGNGPPIHRGHWAACKSRSFRIC